MSNDGRKPKEEIDFTLGSLARHDGTSYESESLQDKVLGGGDAFSGQSLADIVAMGTSVEAPPALAVNKATMECMRGPCRHLWTMTTRFDSQSNKVDISRVRQCNCHFEPVQLSEENVFQCGQWWPATLVFVPESLRPLLRPKLRAAYEWWLRRHGYSFDWKWWSDDVFELDRAEQRGQVKLGVGPAKFVDDAKLHEPTGVKETDDGIYFSGKE
jgi:hypothetical protein